MSTSTMTRKGRVTIPKEIRDRLEVKEGDQVFFVVKGEEIILKVIRGTILDLKGSIKATRHPEDFEKIRQSVKQVRSTKVSHL
ncbi:AbrB/MazE/SpoVT family DNA-binding domain-containing protein [Candidatus Nitrospira salsa]